MRRKPSARTPVGFANPPGVTSATQSGRTISPHRRRWIWGAAILALVAVAGITLAMLLTNDDNDTGSARSAKTAEQLLLGLKSEGLPINGYEVYTAETDRNGRLGRPGQYVSKVNFHDTRLPMSVDMDISSGGTIETFDDEGNAKRWHESISQFDEALGSGYDYRDGTRVLRISSDLTPAQARKYQAAFLALG